MNFLSYPFLLLAFFLLTNLVLGFIKGKRVNTVADFAMGNKTFGGLALFATLLATRIGGGEFYGTPKRLIEIGVVGIFGYIFCSTGLFISGYLLPHQVSRFADCVSFGDFIGRLYGKTAKSFCGFISGVFALFFAALQIQVLGWILNDFFHFDPLYAIIFSTIVISLYTSFGGMSSVVATDILQLCMIGVTVLILLCFIISKFMMGFDVYITKMPSKFFSMDSLTGTFCASRAPMILFLTNLIDIPGFQRLLMSRNKEAAKKMYLYTAIGNLVFGVLILIVVFCAIIILGDKINTEHPILSLISFVPTKMIPLMGLGLIAVVFSTGDSYLHSAGLSLSKDFLEPILKRDIKLIEVRCVTFFSGILSMIVVLWLNGFMTITSFFHLRDPMLAVPVLCGFLGMQSSSKMFWYSSFCGLFGLLISGYIPILKHFSVIIGCLISLIAYFTVHYYENKGFKFIGNPILLREKD